jgi:plastocyanin
MSRQRTILALLGTLLVLVATACTGSATPAASPDTVTMTSANRFQPAVLTVARGTTVTWVNASPVPHSVTADPARVSNAADVATPAGAQAFDSGTIAPGQSYGYTFTVPGTYHYTCLPHETIGMDGTIIVTAS